MDELDDDLDSQEENQPAEVVSEGATLADLKKLRSENKGLRTRLKEAQDQVLTTRFSSEVLELVPEEITDFERRVAFAETLAAKFGPSNEQLQTEVAATEAPVEEPTEVEQKLAAVNAGPAPGVEAPELRTVAEIKELSKTDPDEANRLVREGKFVQQTSW